MLLLVSDCALKSFLKQVSLWKFEGEVGSQECQRSLNMSGVYFIYLWLAQ